MGYKPCIDPAYLTPHGHIHRYSPEISIVESWCHHKSKFRPFIIISPQSDYPTQKLCLANHALFFMARQFWLNSMGGLLTVFQINATLEESFFFLTGWSLRFSAVPFGFFPLDFFLAFLPSFGCHFSAEIDPLALTCSICMDLTKPQEAC